ncbi:cytochrome c oxidase subunit NDUFA4 [Tribolium castaneum]|uniref:NADH dehydrogenase [ubiquinone] 1 alpha subcomplex subunit 4-like Protein n=1 Tax=Tribolium castaneum TaxID=7070 RepID=D6WJL9_TRICA|nr:PREDICTED: cytochrome c oxidase subunit NDUFA4 [Tribolium castaneum]EFA04651.1 NADH dehydrogenase [ubiquinone] 1 alpha subcomplex subunit 4-like Protein [Tribolium castaneum]|eukprot:XP_973527.1 PREDICTED: cytochrome c oxidase subunit NDUFA4 [Tribolium castaneum]
MQGMSLQSLKKHKALIPLYVCVGLGCLGAIGYTARLALRNPDVQWNRSGDISNEEFRNKQYKFYSPNIDYSKLESPAPKY